MCLVCINAQQSLLSGATFHVRLVYTVQIGRFFEIEQRNTTFLTEIRAGIVCFLTVCYIIRESQHHLTQNIISPRLILVCNANHAAVNAGIMSDSGGPCDPAINCSVSLNA